MKTFLIILVLSVAVFGQVSVQINIGQKTPSREVVVIPPGYVPECEYREDLIVISPNMIGFWVRLRNGNFVLHYRKIWYDRDNDVMYYGPWAQNYKMVYSNRYDRFDDAYVCYHYPKYKGKKFHHEDEGSEHHHGKHHN